MPKPTNRKQQFLSPPLARAARLLSRGEGDRTARLNFLMALSQQAALSAGHTGDAAITAAVAMVREYELFQREEIEVPSCR